MSNTYTHPLGAAREPTPSRPTSRLRIRLAVALVIGSLALLLLPASASASAAIKEFPLSAAPSFAITAGPDGNVWFGEQARPDQSGNSVLEVAKITPAGMLTEYSAGIGINGEIDDITAGPDGNVWFTGSVGIPPGILMPGQVTTRFVIGKITPSGAVTEYTIGSCTYTGGTGAEICSGTAARGITSGSDGNLWFIEPRENKIGKITPGGAVTEYSAGISGTLGDITSGPDGNVWFTESPKKIAKITIGGAVTEYSAGFSGTPGDITSGPDGNLWFKEDAPYRIAKITPSGAVTEYRAGIINAPGSITMGSDGNLWFTEPISQRIARITTRGVVTTNSARINGGAIGITRGPDGNLWLPVRGSGSSGYIARFSIKSATQHTMTHKRRGHKRGKKHH
jgi:streptogramin lyase